MPISCTETLKTVATSPLGSIPAAKIEVYQVSGTVAEGKGLKKVVRDPYKIGGEVQAAPEWDGDIIYGEDQTAYCPLVAFNFGQSPPLGITKQMLHDESTYLVELTGHFLAKRPAGHIGQVHYYFGYVSTGYVKAEVSGKISGEGISPHGITELSGSFSYSQDTWIPITIRLWNVDSSGTYPSRRDIRLVFFWKDDIDDEWRVIGSDVTCPPYLGRFENLINTPITAFQNNSELSGADEYLLTIHYSGGTYHFHLNEDMVTEYSLTPGMSNDYNLYGDLVAIMWNSTISHGDMARIYMVRGLEVPYVLTNVNNIELDQSDDAAGVLSFEVPVTRSTFAANNVTSDNMYTYSLDTDSFGVLRQNRLVKAYFGYTVAGAPEYVQRFTGTIQDVGPSAKSRDDSAQLMLSVKCFDARVNATEAPVTKIEDMEIGPLPNQLSYDIAQIFPETNDDQGPDGSIRPPSFDRWKLADVLRVVLYQSGFTSSQLWAKDSNGNFLIDDRSIYLEATSAYPYSMVSELGARADVESKTYTAYRHFWFLQWKKEKTIDTWVEHPENVDMPYLYMLPFDAAPWESMVELCQEYGIDLAADHEGSIYMRYPDNPVIHDVRDSDLAYSGGWALAEVGTAIANVECTTSTYPDAGHVAIQFTGVGIKLIFVRYDAEMLDATGVNSKAIISVKVDGASSFVVVNGDNELDAVTGDMGHIDWIDAVEDDTGIRSLGLAGSGQPQWHYRDGLHPVSGTNPCPITICNNLTYGNHTIRIDNTTNSQLRLEGYMPIIASVDEPHHSFDARLNLSGIEYEDSMDDMVNDVVAIGNQTGAMGEYITSRAVDIASISSDDAPNYVGKRRPLHVMSPKLINQERAQYLAQRGLLRYRRGSRNPVLESSGLPWLAPGDCVSLRYIKTNSDGTLAVLGLYTTDDLTAAQRGGDGVEPVPFQKYWVKGINESFKKADDANSYTTTVTTTSFPPLPAYEPIPEPDQDEYDAPVSNIEITIDGGAASYNPYLADAEGKYVNISFNLNWHARFLAVRILVGDTDIPIVDYDYLAAGDVANVLAARTGFSPSGGYSFKWDGWVQTTRLQRQVPKQKREWIQMESDEGFLAADGNYAVEIETHRYSTGEAFICRAESGMVALEIGSEEYIPIARNRSTVYGATPFTVATTPTGNSTYPSLIYDTTNSGLGLKFDVHLDCPARVEIPITVRFDNVASPPANDSKDRFYQEKWKLLWREDTPVLEPGDYTFYFRPTTMLVKDTLPQAFRRTRHLVTIAVVQGVWYVAWSLKLDNGVKFTDKAGVVDEIDVDGDDTHQDWAWGGTTAPLYPVKALRYDSIGIYYWYIKVKDAA